MDHENDTRARADEAAHPSEDGARYIPRFPVGELRESPTNPRKHFGDLADLATTIRARGILSPLLVRPRDDHHEIVFGHRRYRAALLAGVVEVPVTVRDMSDREVIEAQIIENAQREDIHPMEEAEGFQRLHAEHGYSVEDLAAKVGKSPSYVYGRIRLCALGAEARELFLGGHFQIAVALTLAQVSDPTMQADAARVITTPRYDGHAWSTGEARGEIVRRYMLRLAAAPFDPSDATLVPRVGACLSCPSNTGCELALFPNEKTEAMCTDRACFDVKRDAAWERRKADAIASGIRVLSDDETKAIAPHGRVDWSAPYVALDEPCFDDPKHRRYRELLKGQAPSVILARVGDAAAEIVEKKSLPKLLKAAGHDFEKLRRQMMDERNAAAAAGSNPKAEAERKKRELENKIYEAVTVETARAIADAAQNRRFTDDRAYWQFLAKALAGNLSYGCHAIAKRRGLKGDGLGAVLKEIDALAPGGCRSMIAELLVETARDGGDEDTLNAVAKFYGVDLSALEKAIRDRHTAGAAKPAVKAPKATTEAAKASPAKSSKKPAAKPAAKKPAKKGGAR